MKATATLKVEFMPGDDIAAAFEEATRLAQLLNVFIEFKFNAIKCVTKPCGDVGEGVANYHRANKEGETAYAWQQAL